MVESAPNIKFDRETRLFLSASSAPGNRGTAFYNYFFRKLGINAVYLPRAATDAKALIEAIRTLSIQGCSISMPLKSAVIPFLDSVSPLAARLQSVNTIVKDSKGYTGHNTDFEGFLAPLDRSALRPDQIVIYGNGSVAGTVFHALKQSYPGARIFFAGRRKERVLQRATELGAATAPVDGAFDLLVNATPESTEPSLQLQALAARAGAVYDLVVTDSPSALAQEALSRRLPTFQGSEMFAFQFLRQFQLYTGKELGLDDFNRASKDLGYSPILS